MFKKVTILGVSSTGEDKEVGTITLSGDKLIPDPLGDSTLQSILSAPVYDVKTKSDVSPVDDPETWMENLRFKYRSAYLRATAPEQDDFGELDHPKIAPSPFRPKK